MNAQTKDNRTKTQLCEEIARQDKQIKQITERLKVRTEEVEDLIHQLRLKKDELHAERKAHEETKKQLKISDSRVAAAVEAASEGSLAAGLANRMVARLMDHIDSLQREKDRLRERR